MNKILTIIIAALVTLSANAGIKATQDSLKLVSRILSKAERSNTQHVMEEGVNNMALHAPWLENVTECQSLLIINWSGINPDEIKDVKVTLDNGTPYQVSNFTSGNLETYIFMPCGTKSVTLLHPRYASTRIFLKKMNNKDIWSIPVVLDTPVNIQFKPATDYDKSVRVTLTYPESGMEETKQTPAIFERVVPGNYEVQFVIDGRIQSYNVQVSPTKTVFGQNDFDFRNFKDVTIESTRKARIYIDDVDQGEATSLTTRLPYGSHTLKAVISENSKDEKTVEVNADSENTIYLSPVEMRTFEVIGLYNGAPVPTSIYTPDIDTERNTLRTEKSHKFTLPAVGCKPCTFYLSYGGKTSKKSVSVTPGMHTRQEVKIKADRKVVWQWQRDYVPANHGWEFSWVSKQYSTSGYFSDEDNIKSTIKENGVWADGSDHWLHGFRTGYHAQPSFKFGLGLYTGFFLEFYFSGNEEGIDNTFDKYFELDMSVPLHILYQFPLGRKFTIGFHTGPTFNWAMYGSYYDKLLPDASDTDNEEDYTDFWDEPWAPKRVNLTWDFGLFVRWKALTISGTISQGLTNNKMHTDFGRDAKTVMNKRFAGISLVF